ncbi:MAG: hypothetical protein HGA87_07105 [Desulfobulbaceae bacterium]|nr:hypothetical protein [Desulfobulbaceae bacterium]
MPWTEVQTDCLNPKKSFDEVTLARCCAMASESLNPEEFDAFIMVHNVLIERRKLGNAVIAYD